MSLPLKFDKLMLYEHCAEVMVYFEKHKLMEIISRIMAEIAWLRPADAQLWIAENITRIADKIYKNCIDISNDGFGVAKFYQLPGRFLHRVCIFGRRGSGRKTQAMYLIKHFNLIYIDAEHLIYQNLRTASCPLAKQLQDAFAVDDIKAKSRILGQIISRRLLQMDALRHGWVLLNYPSNGQELVELFQHFKIPPNRFLYLKCSELMALRRLIEQPNMGRPQDTVEYMEHEMRYFNKNEEEIDEYLARRHETIYVDAEVCTDAVKTAVFSRLAMVPYVLGFKA